MSKNLKSIIQSLASSSMLADSIVERMSVYASHQSMSESVASLKQDIENLKAENSRLSALIAELDTDVSSDAVFTDDQQDAFMKAMAVSLHNLTFVEMRCAYTSSTLKVYPKNVIVLICTALLNACSIRGYRPEPLWQDLIANQGVF